MIAPGENLYKYKAAAAGIGLLALLLVPSPLLPPHRLAEAIQPIVDVNWKTSYLIAAIALEAVFYGSIGIVSALALRKASTRRGRLIQTILVPLAIVFVVLVIRSLKMGHLPVWINAVIPMIACLLGLWLGLGLLYQRGKIVLFILLVMMGVAFWGLSGGPDTELTNATEKHLKKLVEASSTIPPGKARFGELMKVAFASAHEKSSELNAVQNNRAAILALGIALGDARLARFVGLNRKSKLLHEIEQLRNGTTLRGRNDWTRHFCLSAALAVLEHPLISDAGGLMKEQLDALTQGSGFSFTDVAADRAGVRFATAATNSEEDAKAMQELLMKEFVVSNFFPRVDDLPENLTTEQFRSDYGAVGSDAYREKIIEIENRLNTCVGLSPLRSGGR